MTMTDSDVSDTVERDVHGFTPDDHLLVTLVVRRGWTLVDCALTSGTLGFQTLAAALASDYVDSLRLDYAPGNFGSLPWCGEGPWYGPTLDFEDSGWRLTGPTSACGKPSTLFYAHGEISDLILSLSAVEADARRRVVWLRQAVASWKALDV